MNVALERQQLADSVDATDLRILRLSASGLTADQVGRRLGIAGRSVRRRLRLLCDRIGVETSIELIVRAAHEGLVPAER